MKRSYAYSLIVFAIAILGSLVWLHFQLVGQALTEAYEFERETVSEAIELAEERLRFLKIATDRRLEDRRKMKFYPIKNILQIAEEGRSGIVEKYERLGFDQRGFQLDEKDQQSMIHQLADKIEKANALLFASMYTKLNSHGQEMDMSEEEIAEKLSLFSKQLEKPIPRRRGILHRGNHFQRRDMMLLSFLSSQEKVLNIIVSIIGSKADEFDAFFPVFITDLQNPQPGDQINARVGIGSYSTYLDPEDVTLTVGSDTLKLGADGVASYKFTAGRRGEYVLKTTVKVRNPQTGEVQYGEGEYTYRVY